MKLCAACHNGFHGAPPACPVCGAELGAEGEVSGLGLTGMRVGERYELGELLGEGAMGWVYRGRHLALDRSVAVKLLKTIGDAQPDQVARFEQEARAASRLHHPHIVSVIDFGRTPGGLFYLVTEFVSGQNLADILIDEGSLPLQRTLNIFHQILAAVEEAHSQRVIHRDLKPENIVVTPLRSGEDFVKVLDFGIATLADEPGTKLTADGAFAGTPGYMAPETIRAGVATERSDIYALGNVLFELLTGQSMFVSDWPMALLTQHLHEPPPRFADVVPELALPDPFERVLTRTVAKDPADRYGSIAELRTELFEAARALGPIVLACDRCARPRDPFSGLCQLHGPSTPAPGRPSQPVSSFPDSGPLASEPPPASRPSPDGTSRTLIRAERANREALLDRATEADPFGRRADAGQLVDFLLGTRRLLELTGEPGSCRGYLLDGLAVAAESLGHSVFRLEPDHRRALRPWYPVRRLVGELLGSSAEPASATALRERADAARLDSRIVDGLALLFGFDFDGAPANGPDRQRRIHKSVARLLAQSTAGADDSCILVYGVADFDRASQGLVRALPRLLSRRPVRMAVGSDGGLLAAYKERSIVQPAPLDREAVERWLERATLPPDVDRPALAARLQELSAGVPHHLEQLLGAFVEGLRIDGTVQQVVARRVADLPTEARRLLRTICALGGDVPLDLIAGATAEDVRLLSADLLLRRGWLVTSADRTLSPRHDALARDVLDAVPTAERRELHGAVVRSLERVSAPVFLLAHHGFEADEDGHSLPWLLDAAATACRWGDHETAALVHYRRAAHVARWHLLLAEDDPAQLRLGLDMGEALLEAGHLASAEVVIKGVLGAAPVGSEAAGRAKRALGRLELVRRGAETCSAPDAHHGLA